MKEKRTLNEWVFDMEWIINRISKEKGKWVKDKLSMKSKRNIQTLDDQSDQTHEQSARVLNLLLTRVLTYNQSTYL